jgi:hypothetical protein
MISLAEAATIAAELAMPDLDLIKQAEQDRCWRFARGRSGNLVSRPQLVVDTFARAIATSDFEPRLQLVEALWLMQFIGLRWPNRDPAGGGARNARAVSHPRRR